MLRRSYALLLFTIASSWLVTVGGAAPPDSVEQSRLAVYESPTGERYFALSLSIKDAAPVADAPRDVVALYDTSASQTGLYREDGLSALENMLARLNPQDRVQLVAVDLNAVALTPNYVAPASAEMKAAIQKLKQRSPLGSTDMMAALSHAQAAFQGNPTNARSVVYIGDGVSRASFLRSQEFASLVDSLVAKRISVSSFGIGPERDVQLLAALANHTGGAMILDTDSNTGQQAGEALAKSVHAAVYWPVSTAFSEGIAEAFPKTLPPLRSDRDSIVIGTLKGGDTYTLTTAMELQGRVMDRRWNLSAEKPSMDFAFVPKLVELARTDGGLRLPTAGSDALREAARVMQQGADQLAKLGEHALVTGDTAGAKAAAEAALKADPANPVAPLVRGAAADRMANNGSRGAGEVGLPAPASLQDSEGGEGRLLEQVRSNTQLASQRMQAEVDYGLIAARKKMTTAPDLAKQDLVLLLESMDRATDVQPEIRAQLRDRVQSAIRESAGRQVEVDSLRAQAQQSQAEAIQRVRAVEELDRRHALIKQLLDKFNYLLEERQYEVAELDVAEQVRELQPDLPDGVVAKWDARNVKNVLEMYRFRDLRHRNFVDALYQVERSSNPFPDEPPIVYPSADVWEQISLSRKKYETVDLGAKTGSAEQKIQEALSKQGTFEYTAMPLQEVMDQIADQFGITILLQKKVLEEAGVDTGVPVDANFRGITLRSALRHILRDRDLTYMVKDEVMQITTFEEAEGSLSTKVYPVGDLVIPPISGGGGGGMMGGMGGGMMGGGMMGGGMGGMGGGMMGGGMGGMGGGMMGGGMGGMGGGFFAVDDELRLDGSTPAKAKPAAPSTVAPAAGKSAPAARNVAPTQPSASAAPAAASKPREIARIQLARQPGVTLDRAWDEHFQQHEGDSAVERLEHSAQIRETVRQLRSAARMQLDKNPAKAKESFGEMIVLIQAALRYKQAQPWMYEALTIAMIANGSPTEEVERALMSAVDFSRHEDEILHIAGYMTRIGLDARALKLYREVAQVSPMRPDPYVNGLAAAKKVKDEAGIRWACVGILSQAWPKEHRQIEVEAGRIAESLLVRYEKEKRTDELAAFKSQLSDALVRDCMVRVSWTGDADIDLSVEEPTATVCSLQNRRTTSGGVLISDGFASAKVRTVDGYSEVYVCPKGFAGQYRLFLRRVWGSVAAGKVTVEIFTNYGTDRQTYGKQQIPLASKDAIVNFELHAGRRIEPLEEEKVANVERARLKNSQAILAQVMPSQVRDSESESTSSGSASGVPFAAGGVARFDPLLFSRRRGVGYYPQVTPLPEGSQMSGLAVISADRRYVRWSHFGTAPINSGVSSVETFSFVSAVGGQGGAGGAGGAGGGLGGGIGGGGLGGGGAF